MGFQRHLNQRLILPSRPEVWTIKLCGSVIAAVFTAVEIFLYQGSYGTVKTYRTSKINNFDLVTLSFWSKPCFFLSVKDPLKYFWSIFSQKIRFLREQWIISVGPTLINDSSQTWAPFQTKVWSWFNTERLSDAQTETLTLGRIFFWAFSTLVDCYTTLENRIVV